MYLPNHDFDRYVPYNQDVRGRSTISSPINCSWNNYLNDDVNEPEPVGVSERWFNDKLLRGNLFDPHQRPRVIEGNIPEINGSSARSSDYSLYYDYDYQRYSPDLWLNIKRYKPEDAGPETVSHKKQYAEMATLNITKFNIPKYKIINPRLDSKLNRYAATEAAELAAIRGYPNYSQLVPDKYRQALEKKGVLRAQQNISGPQGKLIRNVTSFLEPIDIDEGYSHKARGAVSRKRNKQYLFAREIASSLLSKPSQTMARIYKKNPQLGKRMFNALEEISNYTNVNLHVPGHREVLTSLIHHHLKDAEINKIYDERMIEYVTTNDPKYPNMGKIKSSYVKIHKLIDRQADLVPGYVKNVTFPLAVHMFERNIPINIQNIVGESDKILHVKNAMYKLQTDFANQIHRGGSKGSTNKVSKRELDILNQTSKNVRNILRNRVGEVQRYTPEFLELDIGHDMSSWGLYGHRGKHDPNYEKSKVSGIGRVPESKLIDTYKMESSPMAKRDMMGEHIIYYKDGNNERFGSHIPTLRPRYK